MWLGIRFPDSEVYMGEVNRDRTGKVIEESLPLKVLVEKNGLLLALTMRKYSHLIFLSRPLIGYRRIMTRDRIVAKAGYDIKKTIDLVTSMYGHGGR